jgi:hypothetical protein
VPFSRRTHTRTNEYTQTHARAEAVALTLLTSAHPFDGAILGSFSELTNASMFPSGLVVGTRNDWQTCNRVVFLLFTLTERVFAHQALFSPAHVSAYLMKVDI